MEERFSPHITNQTNNASTEATGAECAFLALNDTLLTNFPSLALTHPVLRKQHTGFINCGTGRRGLIKLTGVITRRLPCLGSEGTMEQRCDGEGHEAIIPQCARWVLPVTPCRSRFKEWGGKAQTAMCDGVPETNTAATHLCVYVVSLKRSLFSWQKHFLRFGLWKDLVQSDSFFSSRDGLLRRHSINFFYINVINIKSCHNTITI